jgi:hypothetical protein
MVAGAQVAEYKKLLISTLPDSLFQPKIESTTRNLLKCPSIKEAANKISTFKKQQKLITPPSKTECFDCIGISCSPKFIKKTNLRPSSMHRQNSVCRRCNDMTTVINIATWIERTLATNPNKLKTFFATAYTPKCMQFDNIVKPCPHFPSSSNHNTYYYPPSAMFIQLLSCQLFASYAAILSGKYQKTPPVST